jgi:hypothetical protein
MPCRGDCNQGRECDCSKDRSVDRATVVIGVLLILCLFSIGMGLLKLYNENKGQECQIEVQFKDSRATYIGKTV